MKKVLILIAASFVILLAWQLVEDRLNTVRVSAGETSLEAFVPSPVTILSTFAKDGALIVWELHFTLLRAIAGLAVGIFIALALFSALIYVPFLRHLVFPFTMALNSFPIVGMVPLIILAFGQGSPLAVVLVAALMSYLPLLIAFDRSVDEINPDILDVMRSLRANRRQMMTKLYLPLSLPNIFSALRLSIPGSIIGAMIGEWFGIKTGLGQIVTISLYQLKPGLLYASLITIVFVSLALLGILVMLERHLLRWR